MGDLMHLCRLVDHCRNHPAELVHRQVFLLVQLVGGAAWVLHDQFGVEVMRLGRATQQERPHLCSSLLPRLWAHAIAAGQHQNKLHCSLRAIQGG